MGLAAGKTLDEIIDDTTLTLQLLQPTWIRMWQDLRTRVAQVIAELELLAREHAPTDKDGCGRAMSGGIVVEFDPDAGGILTVSVVMGNLWDSPEDVTDG